MYGVISLTFWSVTIIVTIKYVLLVMRADNDGEGGILALITLIRRRGVPGGRRTKLALDAWGIFGASLFCRRQHDHPSRCCPPSKGSRWSSRRWRT